MLIDIVIPFGLVFVVFVARWLLKKPLFYDPYGAETKRLKKEKNINFFLDDSINDAVESGKREIKIIADMNEIEKIVDKTKDKEFNIEAITGPKEKFELIKPLANNIKVHRLSNRPVEHFAIIGPNLLVETPHQLKEFAGALGIRHPYASYYSLFTKRFDKEKSASTQPKQATFSDSGPQLTKFGNR
ncbi:MAG: hypothetical protein WB392_09680 [Methanotrichaceae archaeon]